jgi:uncharacterized protein
MIDRHLASCLLTALQDTPVVFLAGARQVGKTTLVRSLVKGPHPATYLSFDDLSSLAAARTDPEGFLAGLDGPVVLDEIQRVPELLLPIKAAVDRDRTPGRFLLTGSANVLALPSVTESLAGRMEVSVLWPFSAGELAGSREGFVDALFSDRLEHVEAASAGKADTAARIARGGFPEIQQRPAQARREAWFDAYLTTVLERDVRDLANIEGLTQLPNLLALIAARHGGLASFADLSRAIGLPQTTLKRYLALLEAIFLVHRLPAWSANLSSRLVKAPKLFLTDCGLAARLTGINERSMTEDPRTLGPLLEAFVVAELRKQSAWSSVRPRMYHYRTHTGREVDIVLEDARGRLVAIEVKAAVSLNRRDTGGVAAFADVVGGAFHRGVILHLGSGTIPLRRNIHALPIEALWRLGASKPAGNPPR